MIFFYFVIVANNLHSYYISFIYIPMSIDLVKAVKDFKLNEFVEKKLKLESV